MKKILVALLLMAVSWSMASIAAAQADDQLVQEKTLTENVRINSMNEKMMPKPEVQLARLTKGLMLTNEQQKKIRPILEDEYTKLEKIRHNEDLSPKKIQVMVEELRSNTGTKINSYLIPEQQKKYSSVVEEIKINKQQRIKQNRKDRINSKADQSIESGNSDKKKSE